MNQQPGMSQPHPRPPSGVSDMAMLQQQFLYKKVQEYRQRHLQHIDQGVRQQGSYDPFNMLSKQNAGDQIPAVVNGTPVHDTAYMWPGEAAPQLGVDPKMLTNPQMFMSGNINLGRNVSPALQGFPNGMILSHDQSPAVPRMGLVPQQMDASAYFATLGATRDSSVNAMVQYPNPQWASSDNTSLLSKASGNHIQKTIMQPNAFGSLHGDQSTAYREQLPMDDCASSIKPIANVKNLFPEISAAALNEASVLNMGNYQHSSPGLQNQQVQEVQGRSDNTIWSGNAHGKGPAQGAYPQGFTGLDPLEQKFLYNKSDNVWDQMQGSQSISTSFPGAGTGVTGDFLQGNQSENSDYLNMFPSVQSGSWSALMQSAMAEASSSETGLQDEWSGLSYQKAEPSQLNDNSKQPISWNDHSIHTESSLPKPFPLFDDSTTRSRGDVGNMLQPMALSCTFEQNGRSENEANHNSVRNDVSSDSLRRSPKEVGWLEPGRESPVVNEHMLALGNASESNWRSQTFACTESSGNHAPNMRSVYHQHQPGLMASGLDGQVEIKQNYWNMNESSIPDRDSTQTDPDENIMLQSQNAMLKSPVHMGKGLEINMWAANKQGNLQKTSNQNIQSLSSSSGRFEQDQLLMNISKEKEDASAKNFVGNFNSSFANLEQDRVQQVSTSNFYDHPSRNEGAEHADRLRLQMNQHPQFLESLSRISGRASTAVMEKQREIPHRNENFNDAFASNHLHPSRNIAQGVGMRQSMRSSVDDPCSLVNQNQMLPGNLAHEAAVSGQSSRKFLYHPMGNSIIEADAAETIKHNPYANRTMQAPSHGQKIIDRGVVHPQVSCMNVDGRTLDSEKNFLNDNSQNNMKGSQDALSNVAVGGENPSSTFDGTTSFNPFQDRITQPSTNMLELFNTMDRQGENTMKHGLLSSGVAGKATSHTLPSNLRGNQLSSTQGFGLHLAPPGGAAGKYLLGLSGSNMDLNSGNSDSGNKEEAQMWQGSADNLRTPEASHRGYLDKEMRVATGSGPSQDTNSNTQGNPSNIHPSDRQYFLNQFRVHENTNVGSLAGEESKNLVVGGQVDHSRQVGHTSVVVQRQCSVDGHAIGLAPQAISSDRADAASVDAARCDGREVLPSRPANMVLSEGTSQHSSYSTMLQNMWANVPAQRNLPGVAQKVVSNPAAAWAFQKVPDQIQISSKGEGSVSDVDPASTQYHRHREEKQRKGSPSGRTSSSHRGVAVPSSSFDSQEHDHSLATSSTPEQTLPKRTSSGDNQALNHSQVSQGGMMPVQMSAERTSSSHHNYSLLHQMQAMRNVEYDPKTSAKRIKVDGGVGIVHGAGKSSQQASHGYTTSTSGPHGNSRLSQQVSSSLPDARNTSDFSAEEMKQQHVRSPTHNFAMNRRPTDPATSGQNKSQDTAPVPFSLTPSSSSIRGLEHLNSNSKMATTWFEQYGTYKNGQYLSMAERFGGSPSSSRVVQQYAFGRVSEGVHVQTPVEQKSTSNLNQVASVMPPANTFHAVGVAEQTSVPTPSKLDTCDQFQPLVRPKKRKKVRSELQPWNKVISLSSRRHNDTSVSELKWAHVTNRRMEKIDEDADMIEDGSLIPGPRRRIIFTTQLIQQIFPPLPTTLLSSVTSLESESVAYIFAKMLLGDACSLSAGLANNSCTHHEIVEETCKKCNSYESSRSQYMLKRVEGFVDKIRKMDDNVKRLEKGVSILDVRADCYDLERFSIFNRFWKLYGKGPVDGSVSSEVTAAGSSSAASLSSDGSGAAPRRLLPQRYVTPVPAPRNLPEGVLCHSL